MALEMFSYQEKQISSPGAQTVDALVKNIKDIAYGETDLIKIRFSASSKSESYINFRLFIKTITLIKQT
jgi:hypothetical protein